MDIGKKKEYDERGNIIYRETSDGYWVKKEYDERRNGTIRDKRPKPVPEYTMEELVNKLGHNFKIKK